MPSRYVTAHSSVSRSTTIFSLPAVHGTGTVGKISMWTAAGPSGNTILGDSIITQLGGNVGIGTDSPTSKLTVNGMIETTMGGYKFPDGTVQTTAGLTSVFHDSTLEGDGTSAAPLRVAVPLVLQAIGAPGSNGSIVNATNFGIGGFGMRAAGGVGGVGLIASAIASTTSSVGIGVDAFGGRGFASDDGGIGVRAFGGFSSSGTGGVGVRAIGGRSESGTQSGTAVVATGGPSFTNAAGSYFGGHGVQASGGSSTSTVGANTTGGHGVVAAGGDSNTDFDGDGFGGHGVVAIGGNSGTFSGQLGGSGVVATGGNPFGKGVTATGGIGGHDNVDSTAPNPRSAGVFATGGATTGLRFGGIGVFAKGGPASGSDKISGMGLWAEPGSFADGATLGTAAFLNGKVFTGELWVNGDLTVSAGSFTVRGTGTKNFKIDHPLDPENKYLLHASVESSEVLNIYSGNAVTDRKGKATVMLPEWFEALNRDLRYQLTVIGTFAQAIVAEKVKQNRFTIRTDAPNVEVSWQVTGVRSDAAMQKHPFKAVEVKPESERGTYLDPNSSTSRKSEGRGGRALRN
jgi:hypothetical protein